MSAREIIDLAKQRGISVARLMREQRGEPELSPEEAIALYRKEEIAEGQLAESLGVDRLEVRRIIQEKETSDE